MTLFLCTSIPQQRRYADSMMLLRRRAKDARNNDTPTFLHVFFRPAAETTVHRSENRVLTVFLHALISSKRVPASLLAPTAFSHFQLFSSVIVAGPPAIKYSSSKTSNV